MNILMISNYFAPRIGGVEKVVGKLCEQLQDHEITIITEKHEQKLKDVERFNRWTMVHRFNYPHNKYIGLLYIWMWVWKNRRLIANADLVHIHDVFIWYLPFRFLFPFKPVYMTYHGWEGKLPIPANSLIQKKLAYYLTKGNICVGQHLEKYYGIKATSLTYGGTYIPRHSSEKILNSFIYVGRLTEETGLHLVLQSLKKLKNYTIEFCGDGEMREECEKYGKVHGFIKDPAPYLAKAEFCFAGGYLTTLEALAHKCIVCLCYQNELKEEAFRVAPFAPFIIIENNPEKVAKRINFLLKDRKEMKKMIDQGYNWVKGQTWEKYSNEYRELWGLKN